MPLRKRATKRRLPSIARRPQPTPSSRPSRRCSRRCALRKSNCTRSSNRWPRRRRKLIRLERAMAEKESRLEILRQLNEEGEGLAKGSQAVLKGLDDPERIRPALAGALVASLDVDREYIAALEAALRPKHARRRAAECRACARDSAPCCQQQSRSGSARLARADARRERRSFGRSARRRDRLGGRQNQRAGSGRAHSLGGCSAVSCSCRISRPPFA